ncbi:M23 family metallopeptidase [Micromonospora sp. NPDC000089]|uniref:M23 family metallopeptidase n=1 Tax=unclassified Micromonospora TaxID=2617518 RepID=UPI00367B79CE
MTHRSRRDGPTRPWRRGLATTAALATAAVGATLVGVHLTGGAEPTAPTEPAVRAATPSGTAPATARTRPPAHPPSAVPPVATPPAPTAARVFPVRGRFSYARTHHGYPATDILAPCGTPVVAAAGGVVLEVERTDRYDARRNAGATRGGLSVSLLGDDGVRYYGSHFSSIVASVRPGTRVRAGDRLGDVGRTGDAAACHLHFGISPPCDRTGDWWIRRGVVWPWPYLDSWRRERDRSPVAEVTAWRAGNGCPRTPLVEP